MAKTEKQTDQIRQLKNRVVLSGALAEIEYNFGTTNSTGVKYIRVKGVIQCGETAVYKVSFSSFIKAQKADGTDNDNYDTWKDWLEDAVPMTKDTANPTMVKLIGSMTSNPYVGSDGKLRANSTQNNMTWIYDFDEYACTFDVEGFIYSITDEVVGKDDDQENTGRKKIRLLTMDFYHNVLDIPNIYVPEEMVDSLDEYNYEKGATVQIYVDWIPSESSAPVVKNTSGFGKQRAATGRNFLQLVLSGGDEAYDEDSDKAISTAMAKAMIAERKSQLEEIENAGYQGGKNKRTSGMGKTSGKTSSKKKDSNGFEELGAIEDDDSIPF